MGRPLEGDSSCRRCGATLGAAASFCGSCGWERSKSAPEVDAEVVERRAFASIALGYAGTLGMLLIGGWFDLLGIASTLLLVPVAVASFFLLPASLRARAAGPPLAVPPTILCGYFGAAIASGLLSFGVAWVWVGWLSPNQGSIGDPRSIASLILAVAVLPAIVEELVCRGVLWTAMSAVTTRTATLIGTAALFALMHGLNGGFVAELPHRFAAGLLFGLLRAWTGRLWPPVLAHFTLNFTAIMSI